MKKILIPLTALLAGVASAAPKITPQSIVVNPVPANVGVSVWTDRDPSGQGTPNYNVGDPIRIYTSVTQDAYVYLFNVNPDGSIDQILPNRLGGDNFVKANTVAVFPGSGSNFMFNVAGPYGVNKVLALASTSPLNLSQISSFTGNSQFAQVRPQGQQQLAQALSIVVTPVPQDSWITDTAQYNVAGGQTVYTPPVRPAPPVQPVPTPPAPPVYSYPTPQWSTSNVWTYTTNRYSSQTEVYNFYVDQLRRQGYGLFETRRRGNGTTAYFNGRGRARATLTITIRGDKIEVRIERRN